MLRCTDSLGGRIQVAQRPPQRRKRQCSKTAKTTSVPRGVGHHMHRILGPQQLMSYMVQPQSRTLAGINKGGFVHSPRHCGWTTHCLQPSNHWRLQGGISWTSSHASFKEPVQRNSSYARHKSSCLQDKKSTQSLKEHLSYRQRALHTMCHDDRG